MNTFPAMIIRYMYSYIKWLYISIITHDYIQILFESLVSCYVISCFKPFLDIFRFYLLNF